MAVTMKNGVFWDVLSRGSCKTGHFGGTELMVATTANIVPM
jgi:hypothetical protein